MPTTYEPQDTPYVVGDQLTPTVKADSGMAGLQASEVFHVTSNQAIGSHGEGDAFAKRSFGTSASNLRQQIASAGSPEAAEQLKTKLEDRLGKDLQNAGNAAPLFFTAQQTDQITKNIDPQKVDVVPDYGVLTPKLATLNNRAVICSQIDKALDLNILSEEKHGLSAEGQPLSISGRAPGVAVLQRPESLMDMEKVLDVKYDRPEIQRGLSDLEALDYITGQIDRHAGNIFVDPQTGKVTGIDNDLALPEVSRAEMLKDNMLATKAVRNPPLYMHEETAAKIEAMTPEALGDAMRQANDLCPDPAGKISETAIEGAQQRLVEMQGHIQTMRQEGRIVPEFDKNTFEKTLQHQQGVIDQDIAQKRANTPVAYRQEGAHTTNELNGAPRTSYLGSVAIEQQKTDLMNARYQQREVITGPEKTQLVPTPLEQYQIEKTALKEKFRTDPSTHEYPNVAQAGVPDAIAKHEAAENRVQQARQQLAEVQNPQQGAGGWARASSPAAIERAQKELADALKEKVQTGKALDAALEKSVESLKPQIEQNAVASHKANLQASTVKLANEYGAQKIERHETKKELREVEDRLKFLPKNERNEALREQLEHQRGQMQADLKKIEAKLDKTKDKLIDNHQQLGEPIPSYLQSTGDSWKTEVKQGRSQNAGQNILNNQSNANQHNEPKVAPGSHRPKL
ncbi:Phosphatidylinositol 3-and 4-kinase [Prosthecobacter debontii]|uniref:Phosphatidylinositol 3-and 4-kinase n=1 Tax=Prosthecobacter debontii TaxID=48467 RepID=A0A1T4XZU2_9BACT|nr:hypothetical protein [Prosthecobacter debontii]SKA95094.1 Phosphatidylinositol 3-and 4-kinase [Prosthecobacter debontii]